MRFPIEQIWIEEDARDAALTQCILAKLPGVPVRTGPEIEQQQRELILEPDPFGRGKRILRLMRHKGAFVKPCPGTPEYVCCGLEILHIGQGCPMDCRYCALQVYFNRPTLEVFVNREDLFSALDCRLSADARAFHRICTGEFTDSLALDPLTGLATELVRFFAGRSDAALEIKTKTDLIGPLLDLDPKGRVVVSFSVNAASVARSEDRRAAPLENRIAAAARCHEKGYRVGFHFDPIIPVTGWQEGYRATIDLIFRRVHADAIAWISMGVLRFVPELKQAALDRFGPVQYFHDGFVRGLDGKSRVQADRRIEVYRTLAERIRFHGPDTRLYLCMESPYVWREGLGITMEQDEDLASYLDAAFS